MYTRECFIKNIEYKCRTCFEPQGRLEVLENEFAEFLKTMVSIKVRGI